MFEKGTAKSGGLREPEVRPVLCRCGPNGTKKNADKAESCGDDAKGSQLPLNGYRRFDRRWEVEI